mgnify:CR=1 FL=1
MRISPARTPHPPFAHVRSLVWSSEAQQLSVEWTPTVTDASAPPARRDVWRSLRGEPFVAAAGAERVVSETHGNFLIRDRIRWQCVEQRVQLLEPAPTGDGVIMRGSFDDESSICQELHWSLTFAVAPEGHMRFNLQLSGASAPVANRVQITHELAVGAPLGRGEHVAVWGLGVQYR